MNRHDPFMNNTWNALVISGEVYVAWKRKMFHDVVLHDVIGGHQVYIHARRDYKLLSLAAFGRSLRENKPTKTRQNWHCFLTCFVPALLYRCLHPGLTSDLTSFFPLNNFTSSGTFALRKYLSLAFFKKESDVLRTSAPFFWPFFTYR